MSCVDRVDEDCRHCKHREPVAKCHKGRIYALNQVVKVKQVAIDSYRNTLRNIDDCSKRTQSLEVWEDNKKLRQKYEGKINRLVTEVIVFKNRMREHRIAAKKKWKEPVCYIKKLPMTSSKKDPVPGPSGINKKPAIPVAPKLVGPRCHKPKIVHPPGQLRIHIKQGNNGRVSLNLGSPKFRPRGEAALPQGAQPIPNVPIELPGVHQHQEQDRHGLPQDAVPRPPKRKRNDETGIITLNWNSTVQLFCIFHFTMDFLLLFGEFLKFVIHSDVHSH